MVARSTTSGRRRRVQIVERRGYERSRLPGVWAVGSLAILTVVALPFVSLAVVALGGDGATWRHLFANVLPAATMTTLLLLIGVGAGTLMIGTATAWLIAVYRFPGRDLLSWLLLLPLAMPTYIIAYCYADLLDFSGPLQTAWRGLIGAHSHRDYWFPEVRSLGGAILLMALVLYPYVYLSARAVFAVQSASLIEAARTLGRTAGETLFAVALPLARPALAAGVMLALMECLNDIGAVRHFGVETLTVAAFSTWSQRDSLAGAAGIALATIALLVIVIAVERLARRGSVRQTRGRGDRVAEVRLSGRPALIAAAVCALPPLFGFVVPLLQLVSGIPRALPDIINRAFWSAAATSVVLAAATAIGAVALALVVSYARRIRPDRLGRWARQGAGLGYALPGTLLAVGLLVPLAAFDNTLDGLMRGSIGISTGLLTSGTLFALLLAYQIRFLAVSLGTVDAGFETISPSIDAAARTLGQSSFATLKLVLLPILQPSLGAAALLVFVDTMKELPATLLLRPFNTSTLATRVYDFASLEQVAAASVAALLIVACGLVPLIALERTIGIRRIANQQ